MEIDEFLNSYKLKFSLINQEEDSIIAITELVDQSTLKVVTNIMTKIDVQEDNKLIENGSSLSSMWNFDDMVEITRKNQLEFLLNRFTSRRVLFENKALLQTMSYI